MMLISSIAGLLLLSLSSIECKKGQTHEAIQGEESKNGFGMRRSERIHDFNNPFLYRPRFEDGHSSIPQEKPTSSDLKLKNLR